MTKILNEWNLPKIYRLFVEVMSTRITSDILRIFCYLGNSEGEIRMAAIQ